MCARKIVNPKTKRGLKNGRAIAQNRREMSDNVRRTLLVGQCIAVGINKRLVDAEALENFVFPKTNLVCDS